MITCHCEGELAFRITFTGHTVSECTECGATACVLRIPAAQFELDFSPEAKLLARSQDKPLKDQVRGVCASLSCDTATIGRVKHCDECRAVRQAEHKRQYYLKVMKPARRHNKSRREKRRAAKVAA